MTEFFLMNQGPMAVAPEVFVQGLVDLIMRAATPTPVPIKRKLTRL
jgi:hypothetical protein